MAEDEDKKQEGKGPVTFDSMISQIAGEVNKKARDGVKNKLKDLLEKKREAEKTIAAIDLEMQKVFDDFQKGLI